MAISVAAETPLQDDVRRLVDALNETLLALTPPEFCFHMTAEQMAQPDTTVFLAREDGAAVACGALRRHADGVGEVKRMYTLPSHQGRGIGGLILDEIETLARRKASPAWCSRPAIAIPRPGGCTSARLHPLRPRPRYSQLRILRVFAKALGAESAPRP